MPKNVPSLAEVLDILHEIAPLELAADWDNTGLLVEPKARRGSCARLLLTIDLTDEVVAEAVKMRADLVVAYHPPIFQGMKRLHHADGKQRAVLHAVAAGLAVYSPHTALDAAPGGIAEWLTEGVLAGAQPEDLRPCGDGDFGRVVQLPKAIPFSQLLLRIKKHLSVRSLQVARPSKAPSAVRTVAVAAGAGGSVLRSACADVFLTGEMSHHDTLAVVGGGASVVVAGHSNTERGYLKVLQKRLVRAFGKDTQVAISRADRDPFTLA
ncbi:MAG: Nif3-like dinuclear metal center hexameric protein [Planctomycetes bacterium]|nr:Nif3-like dinuclear metal center hexameric protein [Planctomycetota bacterium]MCC7063037.1 Nif3-like dinuclear metal center hexameric protein [Planctomycetota bacterium]